MRPPTHHTRRDLFYKHHLTIAILSILCSPRHASSLTSTSLSTCTYWRSELLYNKHMQRWGGTWWLKYPPIIYEFVKFAVWEVCQARPHTQLAEYKALFRKCGIHLSTTWFSRLFKSWKWSYVWRLSLYEIINLPFTLGGSHPYETRQGSTRRQI